jgi:leucyl-tRNA synthetase
MAKTQIERYDPASFEPKWVDEWERSGLHQPTGEGPKYYALEFFPYPSGDLHVGHAENYSIGDAIARYSRLRGFDVLHPMGFDAFGLPAENAAIERGVNPKEWTYANIAKHTETFKRFGSSLDWARSFNSCDVDYYRWNQWFFIKFFERGLAYRKESPVNWCPFCKTVVANEQVEGGIHERCGTVVTKRNLPQWFFRITEYADRLLDDMEQLTGWSDRIVAMQRNWIGRSEGAEVTFTVAETGEAVPVFTTRPDTLWGVTFFCLAPEHPMARALAERAGKGNEFDAFLAEVNRETEIDRTAIGHAKKGFDTGAHAINPVNGESVPIWVADYILMEYGTGAIMAVPAHDQRDFEFARQYGIPVRVVIQPEGETLDDATMTEPYPHEGVMVNSGPFDGTPADRAVSDVIAWLEKQGLGKRTINYKMRDWGFSRQRYWGTPIPIIHCPSCGVVPVPESDLPVELPEIEDFLPAESGESPLAKVSDWVNVNCPSCGGAAKRETDTMDGFVDSSWYFCRFASPTPDRAFDQTVVDRWLPVDQYTGGAEHAVMHLLYARFWTKVLHDMGMVNFTEPFPNLLNQGMVLAGSKKMSKSRPGMIVALDDAIEHYGADAIRVSELFAAPVEADIDWETVSVDGNKRWLARVWRLTLENADRIATGGPASGSSALRKTTHQKIAAITEDFDGYRFNTAIARMHELTNAIADASDASADDLREAIGALLIMLSPIAPFITEELWHRLGADDSIHRAAWPKHDASLVAVDTVTAVISVNGKVRDRIEVPVGSDEESLRARALESPNVQRHIEGLEIVKTIVVPPKLVNIVAK